VLIFIFLVGLFISINAGPCSSKEQKQAQKNEVEVITNQETKKSESITPEVKVDNESPTGRSLFSRSVQSRVYNENVVSPTIISSIATFNNIEQKKRNNIRVYNHIN